MSNLKNQKILEFVKQNSGVSEDELNNVLAEVALDALLILHYSHRISIMEVNAMLVDFQKKYRDIPAREKIQNSITEYINKAMNFQFL